MKTEIIAKMSYSKGLFDELIENGFKVKAVKGGLIVNFNPVSEEDDNNVFCIPQPLLMRDYNLLLNISENGGALESTGKATIVCGLSGRPLIPYYIPSGPSVCGNHAYFSIPNNAITVSSYKNSYDIMIAKHQIVTSKKRATIETTSLWYGQMDDLLPDCFQDFQAAATAARAKANCYHCREPHFVAIRDSQ